MWPKRRAQHRQSTNFFERVTSAADRFEVRTTVSARTERTTSIQSSLSPRRDTSAGYYAKYRILWLLHSKEVPPTVDCTSLLLVRSCSPPIRSLCNTLETVDGAFEQESSVTVPCVYPTVLFFTLQPTDPVVQQSTFTFAGCIPLVQDVGLWDCMCACTDKIADEGCCSSADGAGNG
ncbi:unnamed protein product [Cercospora beticola]|nr:unnamed protein product [Cercospora beticola]